MTQSEIEGQNIEPVQRNPAMVMTNQRRWIGLSDDQSDIAGQKADPSNTGTNPVTGYCMYVHCTV
jgi:hypothetical protein